jgi:hypothetical protein
MVSLLSYVQTSSIAQKHSKICYNILRKISQYYAGGGWGQNWPKRVLPKSCP